MAKMTLSAFIEKSHIPEQLIRATVKQIGRWTDAQEVFQDCAAHGADAGFLGFTYYSDTVPFYRKNQRTIREMLKNDAESCGFLMLQFVKYFRCMKDYSEGEIAEVIYSTEENESYTYIANGLAWYVLEEVSRSFVDLQDQK